MSKLLDKLSKNSTISETSVLSKSQFFQKDKELIPTYVPIINAALSAKLSGGFGSGVTTIAGESKRFKSLLGLVAVRSFLEKYDDGVVLFYDNEFGITPEYLESIGIDSDRVIHSPLQHIEQMKFDVRKQLECVSTGEKVMIFIDSVGNIASKKEDEDALEGKSKADMTRAKELKSFFRITRPYLIMKDIPMWVINHTYKSMERYPQDIVSGGCVVGGTQIILPDGMTKAVEDFEPGDVVLTEMGTKEVTHTWNPETLIDGYPECYEIEFEDGSVYTVSDNHMFLVGDKWVKACDLRENIECKTI